MSVLSILGAMAGCASALYLSETIEFSFLKFANPCQSEIPPYQARSTVGIHPLLQIQHTACPMSFLPLPCIRANSDGAMVVVFRRKKNPCPNEHVQQPRAYG